LLTTIITAILLVSISSVAAFAECSISGSGEVNVISVNFPVLEVISKAMRECERKGLNVTYDWLPKKKTEAREEVALALSAANSPYDLAQVANSSITLVQAAGRLQSMNDLVSKYRDKYNIEESMLVRFGNEIKAIAFQANAQHLFYRKDLLAKYDIAVPKTYADVLAAAEKLKSEKSIDFPLGGTYREGWNVAQEFTNIFLAMGGEFFKPGTTEPAFNSEKGVATLELMKKLMAYMSPNVRLQDTTAVAQQFQQGQVAMANLWASRASKMDDPVESKVVGLIDFAAAPAVIEDGPPATTLWWDGFVMHKNMDVDRDLAFQVLMEGLKEAVVKDNNDVALWLRSVYTPTRFSNGVVACAAAGAPSYPMLPQTAIAHTALGNHIGSFLWGTESARESLARAATAFITSAREKGYIK
jgi:ABC-type glycerol-3-phosphate transport system substrate-binding protein